MAQEKVWLTWLRWLVLLAAAVLLVWSLVSQQWITAVVAVLVLLQQVLAFRYERRAARRREHAP
jgi:positive regulator of sigma E activity